MIHRSSKAMILIVAVGLASSLMINIPASYETFLVGDCTEREPLPLVVYILSDGSVDPVSAPISNAGNIVYSLTADILGRLVVQRSNIILEGNGHSVSGGTFNDTDSPWICVTITHVSNVTLANMSLSSSSVGVYTVGGENVSITNTVFSDIPLQAIRTESAHNLLVDSCTFLNSTGIRLESSDHCIIRNNTMSKCGQMISIWLDSTSNVVSNNRMTDCWDFWVSGSDNSVESNWLNNTNRSWGRALVVEGDFNSIVNNTILGFQEGLGLQEAMNTSVRGNHIGACWGIGLWMSYYSFQGLPNPPSSNFDTGNIIAGNDFVINHQQLSFYGGPIAISIWDDGYPAGGNYWSDHESSDSFSGPNQDLPGGDEIGDTQLELAWMNYDRFPLMIPVRSGDITPPLTYDDYVSGRHTADFTVNLTAMDDLGSVNDTYYIIDDGPIMSVKVDGQPRITIEGDSIPLRYWSIDGVGNVEPTVLMSSGLFLDKTPPVARFVLEAQVVIREFAVFNASNSSDNLYIQQYFWDFGDGHSGQSGAYPDANPVFSHLYEIAGSYTVNLTVVDYAGHANTTSLVITVGEASRGFGDYLIYVIAGVVIVIVGSAVVSVLMSRRRYRRID